MPFARSIKDVHSEFRLLSKLTELLMKQKQYEEALQYATLAVQVSTTTGKTFTCIYSSVQKAITMKIKNKANDVLFRIF